MVISLTTTVYINLNMKQRNDNPNGASPTSAQQTGDLQGRPYKASNDAIPILEHSVTAFTRVLDEATVVLLFRDNAIFIPISHKSFVYRIMANMYILRCQKSHPLKPIYLSKSYPFPCLNTRTRRKGILYSEVVHRNIPIAVVCNLNLCSVSLLPKYTLHMRSPQEKKDRKYCIALSENIISFQSLLLKNITLESHTTTTTKQGLN
ncbi:hypothetical protein HYC85_003591 [Camellia sinensis]|uniref:Uncharacterized protein n=1 Tax=Camellia sinensis TaxID=4442 RepID=A0A7J7HW97_CAMSI|nr:hypothetical protein HYC85_003591 [Camellia sinensis]